MVLVEVALVRFFTLMHELEPQHLMILKRRPTIL
jgi:hypothetical protein